MDPNDRPEAASPLASDAPDLLEATAAGAKVDDRANDRSPGMPPDASVVVAGKTLTIRTIARSDVEAERAFVRGLSEESAYLRFMMPMHELPAALLARFIEIDGRRTMAFVATEPHAGGDRFVGVARYFGDAAFKSCEFAVTAGDAWQAKGLGTELMTRLIDHARRVGFSSMFGLILRSNDGMLALARRLGFTIAIDPSDATIDRATLVLHGNDGTGH